MAACNLLIAGITVDCTKLPGRGVDSTVYIGNWDEIRTAYPTTVSGAITSMKMAIGKQLFAFEGQRTSAKPKAVGRKVGDYEFLFDHEVGITIFKVDAASFLTLQNMKGAKVFFLIKHNFTGTAGETKWKFYGLRNGMFLESMQFDPYDANTGGVSLGFKSDALSPEPELPPNLFITDITTTEVIVTALQAAGV